MVEATDPAWTPLATVEVGRLEKRFGSGSGRVVRAALTRGSLDGFWGLDKKIFRAALRVSVPRDHAVATIVGLSEQERTLRAARAFERIREADECVPPLPPEIRGEAFILWSSYCFKPQLLDAPSLEVLSVQRHELATGVLELWSRIFLGSRLAALSPSLRRAEVSIGLLSVEDEFANHLLEMEREDVRPSSRSLFPLPSLSSSPESARALEVSFTEVRALAFEQALRKFWRKVPRERVIVAGPSEQGVLASRYDELLQLSRSELERLALEFTLGVPRTQGGTGAKIRGAREMGSLMRAILDLLRRAPQAARLEAQKDRLARRVSARATWMREMDLGILPDDGLKQTLVEVIDLTDRSAQLSAESELMAALHIASYRALTGLDLSVIDAGLELPTLRHIVDFEEAMTRVRVDQRAVAALSEGRVIDAGPGRRALTAFYREHHELFGMSADAALPSALLSAARSALPVSLLVQVELGRAQVEADRKIAAFEAKHARAVGASLAPLRAQARGLVMIREVARALEVRVSAMVVRVAADIERRLARLEPGIEPGAAYHATAAELIATMDMTGLGLRARTAWRKADAEMPKRGRASEEEPPLFGGLALRRALPDLLRLAYESGPVRYHGRETDTLASSARMIGRDVVIV